MKVRHLFVLCCASAGLLGATSPPGVRVPQAEIAVVNARYSAFGLTLPKGGIILSRPFDPPYSSQHGSKRTRPSGALMRTRWSLRRTYAQISPARR
jgi:hypothetical protein